jgi:hypothetical protein
MVEFLTFRTEISALPVFADKLFRTSPGVSPPEETLFVIARKPKQSNYRDGFAPLAMTPLFISWYIPYPVPGQSLKSG